jgi:D-tagatose-bisphosphate aldolase class II non-catalytic subunit
MSVLDEIVRRNRAGEAVGLPSWCTAHEETLAAILATYRDDDAPVLIEATCNQVNQFGGYTGMTPADFCAFVEKLADAAGVGRGRIVFGGDHLGPNPFTREPASAAMDKACEMVADYVAAGFSKIHLDASMACADDVALDDFTRTDRAARLCAAAEGAAGGKPLNYVIGTEVPVPGGETSAEAQVAVTRPEAVAAMVEMHREAFARHGVGAAFERVVAAVVQPGVDFSNTAVMDFAPEKAAGLSRSLDGLPGLVFEAHSTDYQSEDALRALVQAGFAILKVGPELTFAFRQAALALEGVETELGVAEPSKLRATLEAAMDAAPGSWKPYVAADEARLGRLFGLSDRVRYYWSVPAMRAALGRLFANLETAKIPAGLWAQAGFGAVEPVPQRPGAALVGRAVGDVVRRYRRAAGR